MMALLNAVDSFDFMTSRRIIFGAGRMDEAARIAPEFGSRALVVFSSPERVTPLLHQLVSTGLMLEDYTFAGEGEPTIDHARVAAETARRAGAEMIIGFGGGSALDLAKATAALVTNPGDVLDYLEGIGGGKKLTQKSLPCICIPTTAGTGSEVTKNAVLASPKHKVKVSLRADTMLPEVAIIDPDLLKTTPDHVVAYAGMDAMTQVLEPFTSPAATVFTDGLCRTALDIVRPALLDLYNDRNNASARHDMALVSMFGGIALANARLGAVHGLAGVIGGMTGMAHGAICACLLPVVTEHNIRKLRNNEAAYEGNDAEERYRAAALAMTGKEDLDHFIGSLYELREHLSIPRLRDGGLTTDLIPEIAAKSVNTNGMKGNPVRYTAAELETILQQAL